MSQSHTQLSLDPGDHTLSKGIAKRLDEAMHARNISSQARLARLSGVAQATISRILKGNHEAGPELETSRRLARATRVHLVWLQEGTGPRDLDEADSGSLPCEQDLMSEQSYDFSRFGDRLSYALKFRGLRQAALADELHITSSAVSQFCKSEAPEGGGRYAHEISEFLGVDKLWLRFGEGEPNFRPLTSPATSRDSKGGAQPTWPPKGLSALQSATLENLVKVMQAGEYNDMACLELLQTLKPALEKLN